MTTPPPPYPVTSRPVPNLGIDIGRVLISPILGHDSTHDTPFLHHGLEAKFEKMSDEENLKAPPAEGMWEYVPDIVDKFRMRGGDVWLVSKARSQRTRDLSLAWLNYHDFWKRTGIAPDHLVFTDRRDEKVGVCRHYGINHFIDDRVDCLAPMVGVVPVRVLFGYQELGALGWAAQNETLHAEKWSTAYQQLVWPEQYLPLRTSP